MSLTPSIFLLTSNRDAERDAERKEGGIRACKKKKARFRKHRKKKKTGCHPEENY